MNRCFASFILLATGVLMFGCGSEQETESTPPAEAVNGDKYILAAEPQDARNVIQVREDSQDQDEVVVVGRIGGSANPWVEGMAAFSIVDLSLKACSDIEGDMCEIPWDYCCETDLLPKATVLVKVVDDSGKLVSGDARQLLKVKELQTVVVQGMAKRDEAGNLTVAADGVYLKP
jgi:hypothetical protein